MKKRTMLATMAVSAIACSTVALAQAQQAGASARGQTGVYSAAPIPSESMNALQRAAQRLRESIQSLAQERSGSGRDRAMENARRALRDTQQAMVELPPEYRVSGVVVSNVPIRQANPAQNQTPGDAMQELQHAADRLRDAIQAMAQQPAGEARNGAIREAHEALLRTQSAMASAYGTQQRMGGAGSAHGSISSRAGAGSVMGRGGIAAGSDASPVDARVPAVAGGVGLNARAMLSGDARPDHNVKMIFSLTSGNYVADVDVEVKDRQGRTVIDGMSDGPWLYAKLPAGQYTARAKYNGHTVTKEFGVGRSGMREAHFRWPVSVEQASSGVAPIYGTGQ